MLTKFSMENVKLVSTPMTTSCHLTKDDGSLKFDQTHYRFFIGGFLYLTLPRPNIMHATCMVVRYQANPKKYIDVVVKMIFKYLKGTLDYVLWYKKDSDFSLLNYINSYWLSCVDDKRGTGHSDFFLGGRLVSYLRKKQDSISLTTVGA